MKIFEYAIISVLPLLILKLIFKYGQTVPTASLGLEKMLFGSWLSAANIAFSSYDIYFFMLAIVLLGIYCYSKKIDDKKLFSQYTIYISFGSYLIFLVLLPVNPYWFVLITHF